MPPRPCYGSVNTVSGGQCPGDLDITTTSESGPTEPSLQPSAGLGQHTLRGRHGTGRCTPVGTAHICELPTRPMHTLGGGARTATAPARGRADRSHTLHLSPVPRTGASCSLPYPVTHTPHPAVQAVALDPRLPHTSACLPCDPRTVAAVWELLVLQCQHQTSKRLLKCEMTT